MNKDTNEETNTLNSEDVNFVASKCSNCGAKFKLRSWRKGFQCPECKQGELAPITIQGGAVDYYLANRSSGYAKADIRFAQWAKWCELITPRQYDVAFIKQNKQITPESEPEPIHKIMIEEGWISEKQAINILEFLSRKRPDQDDEDFAVAIINSQAANEKDLEKATKIQREIAEKANEVPPLAQVMLEKRIINEKVMVSLLKKLHSLGKGPLKTAIEAVKGEKTKKTRKKQGVKKLAKKNSPLLKQLSLIALLFVVALGVWAWQNHQPPEKFVGICDKCDEVNILSWSPDLPLRCPDCRQTAVYPARLCRQDDTIFPTKNPYIPSSCPECGSTDVKGLTVEWLEGDS